MVVDLQADRPDKRPGVATSSGLELVGVTGIYLPQQHVKQ